MLTKCRPKSRGTVSMRFGRSSASQAHPLPFTTIALVANSHDRLTPDARNASNTTHDEANMTTLRGRCHDRSVNTRSTQNTGKPRSRAVTVGQSDSNHHQPKHLLTRTATKHPSGDSIPSSSTCRRAASGPVPASG